MQEEVRRKCGGVEGKPEENSKQEEIRRKYVVV